MYFGNPKLLWLLALVPALGLLLAWAFRARRRALEQFVAHPLAERLGRTVRPAARQWKAVLLVGGVLFLILALAQPRWGFEWRQVKRRGVDVFVLLDVSKSMLTEDVRPNRLTQAKYAVEDLLAKLQGDRVGLIAFAGSAFVQCPLTIDYEAFRLTLRDADPHIIPRGGTEIALAIRTALKAFEAGEGRDRAIVLITDGEQTEGDALAAADEAAKAGVRIYAIGVGTTEGELIPIREEGHPLDFVKDADGEVVKSRLDEATLKDLALKTKGIYLRSAAGDFGMDTVYEKGIGQLCRQESEERLQKRFFERFQWPLGIGLFLLVIEMFVSDRRRPNGNQYTKAARSVFLIAVALGGRTFAADTPPEIYNRGVSDYRTNDFQSAVTAFEQAMAAPDRGLQERTLYNLGNTCYRLGQATESQSLDKALPVYKKSLKAYEDSLALNPQDPDAKFNREVVKKKIEELEKKQEQQKQQQQNQSQNQQQQNSQSQNQQQQNSQSQQQPQNQQGEQGQQKQQQPQQAENQQAPQPQQQPPQNQPQQAQAKPDQQKQQSDQQQLAQGQKSEEQQGESQSEDSQNLDKQKAAAMLDNLREDERNWNFYPELQMKDPKENRPPLKDW